MIGQMKRHEIQVLRKAGHEQLEIAELTGTSERSVRRIEDEPPVTQFDDKAARKEHGVGRPSKLADWLPTIAKWVAAEPDLMTLELLRRAKEDGYDGSKSPFYAAVQRIKRRLDVDAVAAYHILQHELQRIREGRADIASIRISFGDYAVSLLEKKVLANEIKSAKSRERWASTLKLHLIPFFGEFWMDQIRRASVLAWKSEVAGQIAAGDFSPNTANGWLAILKVVINAFVFEAELERNPIAGVKDFDTSLHPTYTEEQPNSLLPQEVPLFLAQMLADWPQHYATVALGFGTGLRPSSMRPLRRAGPTPDVLWDQGVLLVRQSHTRRQEVMQTTKTKLHQRLKLPEELMDILTWHVEHNLTTDGPTAESNLLFPSANGGLRSASVLDKPFRDVTAKLVDEGLITDKHLTPRAMRRTFKDLCRAAEVKDIVSRAISGHATEQMHRLYQTVGTTEVEQSIAKVISLSKAREVLERGKGLCAGGAPGGAPEKSKEKRPATRKAN